MARPRASASSRTAARSPPAALCRRSCSRARRGASCAKWRVVRLDRGLDVRQRNRAVGGVVERLRLDASRAPRRRRLRSDTCAPPGRRCTRRRARSASSRRPGSIASPTARRRAASKPSSAADFGFERDDASDRRPARRRRPRRAAMAARIPGVGTRHGVAAKIGRHGPPRSARRLADRQLSRFNCGNRITSRIDGESVSSITSRSMPMPSPAVGGRPYSIARM